jgi:outer membrane immunogenic protein
MRGFALALAGAVGLGLMALPAAASAQEAKTPAETVNKPQRTKPAKLITKAPPKAGSAKTATTKVKARNARAQEIANGWTGFYGGMTLGHLWGHSSWANALLPGTGTNTSFTQGMLGGHLGAQVAFKNGGEVGLLIGTELSYSGSPGDSGGSNPCQFDPTQGCRTRVNDLLTVGGRLGLTYENFLLFGSGGYAQAWVRTEQLLAGDVCNGMLCDRTLARGWYAGMGLDYKLAKIDALDFILGIEWQHIRLDTDQLTGVVGATRNVDVSADVVRARLTVKYNPFSSGTAEGDYKIDW